jgi:hypothetical protein
MHRDERSPWLMMAGKRRRWEKGNEDEEEKIRSRGTDSVDLREGGNWEAAGGCDDSNNVRGWKSDGCYHNNASSNECSCKQQTNKQRSEQKLAGPMWLQPILTPLNLRKYHSLLCSLLFCLLTFHWKWRGNMGCNAAQQTNKRKQASLQFHLCCLNSRQNLTSRNSSTRAERQEQLATEKVRYSPQNNCFNVIVNNSIPNQ